jgi:hypothetical protein
MTRHSKRRVAARYEQHYQRNHRVLSSMRYFLEGDEAAGMRDMSGRGCPVLATVISITIYRQDYPGMSDPHTLPRPSGPHHGTCRPCPDDLEHGGMPLLQPSKPSNQVVKGGRSTSCVCIHFPILAPNLVMDGGKSLSLSHCFAATSPSFYSLMSVIIQFWFMCYSRVCALHLFGVMLLSIQLAPSMFASVFSIL